VKPVRLATSAPKVCRLLDALKKALSKAPGSEFAEPDALGALVYLREAEAAGRQRLSKVLCLGEGSVRGMLEALASAGLVERSKSGARLSERARELLEGLKVFELAPASKAIPWERVLVVQLCGAPADLSESEAVEVRDSVVRWGGLGCISAAAEGKKLKVFGLYDESLAREIESELEHYILDCSSLLGIVGCEPEAPKWHALYGFLEGLCRLTRFSA